MKRLELLIPPVIQVLIWTLLIFVTHRRLSNGEPLSYNQIILGGVVVFLGALTALLGVWEFKKNKTTVDPRYPEKVNELVRTGVYRWTRNPMYLGFLLFLLGLVIIFGHIISLTFVVFYFFYMTRFQILPEERIIEEIFGEAFLEYRKDVGRWFKWF